FLVKFYTGVKIKPNIIIKFSEKLLERPLIYSIWEIQLFNAIKAVGAMIKTAKAIKIIIIVII
nr:hypothetical protein [Clostridia bacterium]